MSTPIKRTRLAKLDELGEEQVFRLYVELGSVGKVMAELFTSAKEDAKDWGRQDFYHWLRAAPGRWDRFTEAKRDRGHVEADLVSEVADAVGPETAGVARVKIDAHKWRAERLNRAEYGPPQQSVGVVVSIGDSWLEALRGATHTDTLRARESGQEACQIESPKNVPEIVVDPPLLEKGGAV